MVTPATTLRLELARLRGRGYSFKQAWRVAVVAALRDEDVNAQVFWRETWNFQKGYWAANFSAGSGIAWPSMTGPTLTPRDLDSSAPAPRIGRAPVAA